MFEIVGFLSCVANKDTGRRICMMETNQQTNADIVRQEELNYLDYTLSKCKNNITTKEYSSFNDIINSIIVAIDDIKFGFNITSFIKFHFTCNAFKSNMTALLHIMTA